MDTHTNIWGKAAIEQNKTWMIRYLLACTGNLAVAEDLSQEIFGMAYENRKKFIPGRSFGAWLRGIARNRLRRYYAETRRLPLLTDASMDILDDESVRSESYQMDEEWQTQRLSALRECLKTLRDFVRKIVIMKYSEGKSGKAIAGILGIQPQKVHWLTYSARKTLFACIERKMGS